MSEENYGNCCACGKDNHPRNFIMLDKRAPVPGTGWGCMVCRLPLDGAIAVVCDTCLKTAAEIRWAVRGKLWEKGRVEVGELHEPFNHDLKMHQGAKLN